MKKLLLTFLLVLVAIFPIVAQDVTDTWADPTKAVSYADQTITGNKSGIVYNLKQVNSNYAKAGGDGSNYQFRASKSSYITNNEYAGKVLKNIKLKCVAASFYVYASNTAYTSYAAEPAGTKIAEITQTGAATIDFSSIGNFKYFCIVAVGTSIAKINGVSITWTDAAPAKDPVATPTADPGNGAELTVGDVVTFACATEGASAKYTVNGGESLTAASFPFSYKFTEAGNYTVAITASKDGMEDATATFAYTVKVPECEATITANNEAGEYAFGSKLEFIVDNADNIDWTVKGLTSDKNIENEDPEGVDGRFVFTLNEDTKVEIMAEDKNGEIAIFEATYTVKRPGPLKYFIKDAEGQYTVEVERNMTIAPWTTVNVNSSADVSTKWHLDYVYLNQQNEEVAINTDFPKGGNANITVYNGAKGKVTATIDNGLDGYSVTEEFEYVVEFPAAPEPDIADGTEVKENTVVYLKLDPYAKKTWVWTYDMDGTFKPVEVYDPEKGIIVDRHNNRFVSKSWNAKGYSQLSEFAYSVVEEFGVEGKDKWELVTSADQVKADGTEYVFAYVNSEKGFKWVMGAESSTNKYREIVADANIANGEINPLPAGASIITFEATDNRDYPFIMKEKGETSKPYLYNNTTSNQITQYASPNEVGYCSVEIDEDNNAVVTLNKKSGELNYVVKVNTTANQYRFASYATGQSLPQLYRHVKSEYTPSVPATYGVKIHYTPYVLDGTVKEIPVFEKGEQHEQHPELKYLYTDEYGAQVYRGTLENLCGRVIIEIDGQEFAGHVKNAITDFHGAKKSIAVDGATDTESCDIDHAPYVYMGNLDRLTLVSTSSANAAGLSTNHNEYHNVLIHHKAPTVTVGVLPGNGLDIHLDSADEDMTGISDIVADSANGAEAWYNLQGVRVANPERGNIYIHVTGNKAVKELVK